MSAAFVVFLLGLNAAVTLVAWRDHDDVWFYFGTGVTALLIYALGVKL